MDPNYNGREWPGGNWNTGWNSQWNQMEYRGGIYYPEYGTEMENQSDMRYMKELYPELAKKVQALVEEECDRMEYEGSGMYDEYPDRVMIYRIVQKILERLIADGTLEQAPHGNGEGQNQNPAPGEEEVAIMQYGEECYGRTCRNPQFEDFIQVILLNEIFKRRANRRNRRRRYW